VCFVTVQPQPYCKQLHKQLQHSQPWVGLSLKAQLDAASAIVQHHNLVATLGLLHRCSSLLLLLLLSPLGLLQLLPRSGAALQRLRAAATPAAVLAATAWPDGIADSY
jgi:hypothetical protein